MKRDYDLNKRKFKTSFRFKVQFIKSPAPRFSTHQLSLPLRWSKVTKVWLDNTLKVLFGGFCIVFYISVLKESRHYKYTPGRQFLWKMNKVTCRVLESEGKTLVTPSILETMCNSRKRGTWERMTEDKEKRTTTVL